jgi:hypothetical protein
MEKKIIELKLDEVQTVAGGSTFTIPAATVAKQPDLSRQLSGVNQPMSVYPSPLR